MRGGYSQKPVLFTCLMETGSVFMAVKALSSQCGIAVNFWKGFCCVISVICGSNVERTQVSMLSSLSLHPSHEDLQW